MDHFLNFHLDRNQSHPLVMLATDIDKPSGVDIPEWNFINATRDNLRRAQNAGSYAVFTGMLQGYSIPQEIDFRLIKTFDLSSYLYFFGEKPPIAELNVVFSDGSLYCPYQEDLSQTIRSSRGYDRLDVLKLMSNRSLVSTADTRKLIGFCFNRLIVRGFIVSIVASGSASSQGLVSTSITIVVKDYKVMSPVVTEGDTYVVYTSSQKYKSAISSTATVRSAVAT